MSLLANHSVSFVLFSERTSAISPFIKKWFILNHSISWVMCDCFPTFAVYFYIIAGGDVSFRILSEEVHSKNLLKRIYPIKNSIKRRKAVYNISLVHLRYQILVIQYNKPEYHSNIAEKNQWYPYRWNFLYPLTNRFSNTESFYMKVLRGTGIPQLGSGSKNYVYAWLFSLTFRSIYLAYH